MKRKILFTSAHNDKLLAWVEQTINPAAFGGDRSQILATFKAELNNLRFQVAKAKTYSVNVVLHGKSLCLEVTYNGREYKNTVSGIYVSRKYWLFGDYQLDVDCNVH